MRNFAGWVLCLFVCTAFAQAQTTVEHQLAALKYPDIASRVRIQGDVEVAIEAGQPRAISGNQLLATQQTVDGAKTLAAPLETAKLIFHFQIVDAGTRIIQRKDPKGDVFDRFILRLLHLRAYRLVNACVEDPTTLPANRAELTRSPIEVWIYTGVHCLQTMTAY